MYTDLPNTFLWERMQC